MRSFVRHIDCIEGMKSLPAGSIDLVFADLPYGRTMSKWDKLVPIVPFWEQIKRICKTTSPVVFTAIEPFTSMLVVSNPSWFRYDMVWRKNKPTGFLNAKKRPLRVHENVLVFWDQQPFYQPQMTDGHEPGHVANRRSSTTRVYGTMSGASWGGSTKRYPISVLNIPIVNNDSPDRTHPNQKPEALSEWFIKTYTRPDDVVLDPTFGSGSTLKVARRLSRRYVGFETDVSMVRRFVR
jgi:DNA modification methylase